MKNSNRKKNILFVSTLIVMLLVGFSSGIYGRFTRQYNPEIRKFSIALATQDKIQVSNDGINFYDTLSNEMYLNQNVVFSPVSAIVDSNKNVVYPMATLANSYHSFDLYFKSSKDMNVYFKGNEYGVVLRFDDIAGVFEGKDSEKDAVLANFRIAISEYETLDNDADPREYSTNPTMTNVYSQRLDSFSDNNGTYNTFSKLGYSNSSDDVIVFSLKKDEVKKVKINVWYDNNDVLLDTNANIEMSIRFEGKTIDDIATE